MLKDLSPPIKIRLKHPTNPNTTYLRTGFLGLYF